MCNSTVNKEKSTPQSSPVWLDQYWENPEGSLSTYELSESRCARGQADRFARSTVLTVLGAMVPKYSKVCVQQKPYLTCLGKGMTPAEGVQLKAMEGL